MESRHCHFESQPAPLLTRKPPPLAAPSFWKVWLRPWNIGSPITESTPSIDILGVKRDRDKIHWFTLNRFTPSSMGTRTLNLGDSVFLCTGLLVVRNVSHSCSGPDNLYLCHWCLVNISDHMCKLPESVVQTNLTKPRKHSYQSFEGLYSKSVIGPGRCCVIVIFEQVEIVADKVIFLTGCPVDNKVIFLMS